MAFDYLIKKTTKKKPIFSVQTSIHTFYFADSLGRLLQRIPKVKVVRNDKLEGKLNK